MLKSKKYSLSDKSIFSRILIINIPLLFILFVIVLCNSIYYNIKIHKDIRLSSVKNLQIISESVEKEKARLSNLILLCKEESSFILSLSSSNSRVNLSYAMQASKQLSIIKYSLPYAQNVFAYSTVNSKFIIANNDIQSKDTFINHFKKELEKSEVIPDFSSIEDGFHIFKNFILYVENVKNYGSIIVQINSLKFCNLAKTDDGLVKYKYVVLNRENQIFMTNFKNSIEHLSTACLHDINEKKQLFKFEGISYNVVQRKDILSGFTYLLFHDTNLLATNYTEVNIISIISILVIMIICTLIIVMNTKIYKPLKDIVIKFSNKSEGNEIEFIQGKILELSFENNKMNEKVTLFESVQNDIALNTLLNSKDQVDVSLIDILRNIYSEYVVVKVAMQDSDGNADDEQLKSISTYLINNLNCHVINIDNFSKAYIIPQGLNYDLISFNFKECFYDKPMKTTVFVGYSDIYRDIIELKAAFSQAEQRMNSLPVCIDSKGEILIWNKDIKHREDRIISLENQNAVANCVLNSTPQNIENMIYDVLFYKNEIPLKDLLSSYEVMTSLFHTIVNTSNIKTENQFFWMNTNKIIYNANFMYKCIIKDYTKINELYMIEKGDMKYNITQYINQNYSNDLSLDALADMYNLSTTYLSLWFKKNIGLNITDYISKVRIEEGKKILIADRSIKVSDVALKVGFCNVMTFIRRFKAHVGTTPEQYRKNFINSED